MKKRAARKPKKSTANPRSYPIWKFLLTYFLFMGLSVLLIGLEPVKKIIDINGLYSSMIVHLCFWLLKPLGIVRAINGSILHLQGVSLNVAFGCNGLEAFLIYTAAVLSFPAAASKKLWGVGLGFVILQVLNIFRIVGLGFSAVYLHKYFEYLHIYVAQGIMIAIALVLFLAWIGYAQPAKNSP